MKDYIPKRPVEFRLEKSLYLRVLHTVRDYPRMKSKIEDVMFNSSCNFTEYLDKQEKVQRAILPHGTGKNNPTEQKALAIQKYSDAVSAIDNALLSIPKEYRQYIFENVVYKQGYPDFADKSTWSRWRTRFLYYVAQGLNMI